MIVKKELSVSGRKKAEVVRELRAKKFTPYPKAVKPTQEGDAEPAEGEQDEDVDTLPGNSDFDYLLQVSAQTIWQWLIE